MFETLRHTCSSSANHADLLHWSNVERHAVERVWKTDSVAQSKVGELNSSFIWPLIGNIRRHGHFAGLLRQILQIRLNWLSGSQRRVYSKINSGLALPYRRRVYVNKLPLINGALCKAKEMITDACTFQCLDYEIKIHNNRLHNAHWL